MKKLSLTAALIVIIVGIITIANSRTKYGASGGFLYAGSQLTQESDIYYRQATNALIKDLFSKGFAPSERPVWPNGLAMDFPVETYFFKKDDPKGRTLYLMLYSGQEKVRGQKSSDFRLSIQFSYYVRNWTWEKQEFRNTAELVGLEIRKWWSDYRSNHPSEFKDVYDRNRA
jgi:hypothetical protein